MCLHNAMTVVFHPLLKGFSEGSPRLFYRALQLPLVLNYLERTAYLKDINYQYFSEQVSPLAFRVPGQDAADEGRLRSSHQAPYLKNYLKKGDKLMTDSNSEQPKVENNVLPEYLNWAFSAAGISSSRQTYETLESYGDTILKLAGTLLAYEWKKNDRKAGEGDIENMKVAFITNFHLFRVGFNLRLYRYIKTLKDPGSKEWIEPLSDKSSQ